MSLLTNEKIVCPLCGHVNGAVEVELDEGQLIRCAKCRLVYAWPQLIPSALYDKAYSDDGDYNYYHEAAAKHMQRKGKIHLPWPMRRFFKHVKSRGELLDIGCSTGGFLYAAKMAKWNITGLEVSEEAAAIARKVSGSQVLTEPVESLSMFETFDAITAWEVLEHVPNPVAFLNAAVRLLKPGGVLGLSVPNWGSPWMKSSTAPEHWPPYHLTYWESPTLAYLLQVVGLNELGIQEKPFAWGEEVGKWKWLYLPISLGRSILLNHKGMHLFALAQKI